MFIHIAFKGRFTESPLQYDAFELGNGIVIKTGLSILLNEKLELIEGKSVGLITNSTGVDENLRDNISLFIKKSKLKAIFSPEHGLWGAVQDAIKIPSIEQDQIPIYSLYGKINKPSAEMLTGIDALIFDIQDVGVRFYTYINTMAMAMEACAENGVGFIVLDRPNPITGEVFDGSMLDPAFRSFVGYLQIPMRHGLTVGELANLYNANVKADLTVIKMDGWDRKMWFDETGLQWVMPSPNMPTLDTVTVYPGMCLFEGTNVSEGRGTTKPFEIIGSPWINPHILADSLNSMSLQDVRFRSLYFVPTFSKYEDESCGGVQVHVIDRDKFNPIKTALHTISAIKNLYPNDFQFNKHFDLLTGTDKVRKALSDGVSADEIIVSWKDDLSVFSQARLKYILY